jgi:hypothetical protein
VITQDSRLSRASGATRRIKKWADMRRFAL